MLRGPLTRSNSFEDCKAILKKENVADTRAQSFCKASPTLGPTVDLDNNDSYDKNKFQDCVLTFLKTTQLGVDEVQGACTAACASKEKTAPKTETEKRDAKDAPKPPAVNPNDGPVGSGGTVKSKTQIAAPE